MLERYTRPEMGKIWTDQNRYQAWLEVEILADEAWAELGEIPKEDVEKLERRQLSISTVSWRSKHRRVMMWSHSPGLSLNRLVTKVSGSTMG